MIYIVQFNCKFTTLKYPSFKGFVGLFKTKDIGFQELNKKARSKVIDLAKLGTRFNKSMKKFRFNMKRFFQKMKKSLPENITASH